MEKFKYRLNIEAPSKEIADMLMEFICKRAVELIEVLKYAESKNEKESDASQENQKEKFIKSLKAFEKAFNTVKAES